MTEDNVSKLNRRWLEQVRNWSANHFTITESSGDFADLFRKLAQALDELGDVEVLDVVIGKDVEGPSVEVKGTVYFAFPTDEGK
ncbi:MAG: hypothetical protein ABIS18_02300 [Actinomycetota bacterium]